MKTDINYSVLITNYSKMTKSLKPGVFNAASRFFRRKRLVRLYFFNTNIFYLIVRLTDIISDNSISNNSID